jgi:hypothetical protein
VNLRRKNNRCTIGPSETRRILRSAGKTDPRRERANIFSTRPSSLLKKNFVPPHWSTNSTYPEVRARFETGIDKLSRRAKKTPLTAMLAGVQSATR